MGWLQDVLGRFRDGDDRREEVPVERLPTPPTGEEILASARRVEERIAGKVPPVVTARVHRITETVAEMVPRLDRLGLGSRQAHTVVATATSYLPEAVGAYLRLPREFADRKVVAAGKTSLLILCDQLDLLGGVLDRISDAVSRQDASALIAHGQFLNEKFVDSAITLGPPTGGAAASPGAVADRGPSPDDPHRLEAP